MNPKRYRIISEAKSSEGRPEGNLRLQRKSDSDLPVYIPFFGHGGEPEEPTADGQKTKEPKKPRPGCTTNIDILVNHTSKQILAPGMRLQMGLITRTGRPIPGPVALNNVCWDFPILEQEGCNKQRNSSLEVACARCGLPSYGSDTIPIYWPPPAHLDLPNPLAGDPIARERALADHRGELATPLSKYCTSDLFALRVFPATLIRISQTMDSGKKLIFSLTFRGQLLHTRLQVQQIWPVRSILGWDAFPLEDSLVSRPHYHNHDSSAKPIKRTTRPQRVFETQPARPLEKPQHRKKRRDEVAALDYELRQQFLEDARTPRDSKTPKAKARSIPVKPKQARKKTAEVEKHKNKRPSNPGRNSTAKKVKLESSIQHSIRLDSSKVHQLGLWAESCSDGFASHSKQGLLMDFLTNKELTATPNHHLHEADRAAIVHYMSMVVVQLNEDLLLPLLEQLSYD